MDFLSSCWLASIIDTKDTRSMKNTESLLQLLFHALDKLDDETTFQHFRSFERKILLDQIAISPRQIARFWFLAIRYYEHLQQFSAAFEACDLCSRVVNPQDVFAMLALHAKWAPIANELGYVRQAVESYTQIIGLTYQLAATPNSSIEATEDNPLYMQALSFCTRHRSAILDFDV